jgi:hypothetical protein
MTFALPNETTYAGMVVWSNNIVGGIESYGILLIAFSIVFLGTKRFGARNSFALLLGSVTSLLVSTALMLMGALNEKVVTFFLIATALAYIYSYHD